MEEENFDEWCLLELFGHSRIAGRVSNANIGGASFIRIDVPQVRDGAKEFTRFYNPKAVYAINPITEPIARELAKQIDSRPVQPWDIGIDPQRQIPFSQGDVEEDDIPY